MNYQKQPHERLSQHAVDIITHIVIPLVFIISVSFSVGFFIGKNRPPTIKTILMEDKADREYIERYNFADIPGKYKYILVKEYELGAEFIADKTWKKIEERGKE